jgi:hypothetical protein
LGKRVFDFLEKTARLRIEQAVQGRRVDPTKGLAEFRRQKAGSGLADFLKNPGKAVGDIAELIRRLVFAVLHDPTLTTAIWEADFREIFQLLDFWYYGQVVAALDAPEQKLVAYRAGPRPSPEVQEDLRNLLQLPLAMVARNVQYLASRLDAKALGSVAAGLATFRRLFEGLCHGCQNDPSQSPGASSEVGVALALITQPAGWENADLLERICRQLEAAWAEVPEFAQCPRLAEPREQVAEWLSTVSHD